MFKLRNHYIVKKLHPCISSEGFTVYYMCLQHHPSHTGPLFQSSFLLFCGTTKPLCFKARHRSYDSPVPAPVPHQARNFGSSPRVANALFCIPSVRPIRSRAASGPPNQRLSPHRQRIRPASRIGERYERAGRLLLKHLRADP